MQSCVAWWRSGRASDLQPIGRIGSSPGRSTSRNDSGQVVHTHVPLFTKQYYKPVPVADQRAVML